MPKRTEVIRDIPDDQRVRLEADYKSLGASIKWEKQPDGNWTLTATFPM